MLSAKLDRVEPALRTVLISKPPPPIGNPLTIFHFVRDLDRASGGPSASVPLLCEALSRMDNTRVVLIAGSSADPVKIQTSDSLVLYWMARNRPAIEDDFDFLRGENIAAPSIVHIHGLWDKVSRQASLFARTNELPVVLSGRGMLEPWAYNHKPLKKRLGWLLYQRRNLRRAATLHATSTAEAESFRRMGLADKSITILPNGLAPPPETSLLRPNQTRQRELLFLGRYHPVKGLDNLLNAWAKAAPSEWTLRLAGPDSDGFRRTLEQQAQQLGLDHSVVFSGPLHGEEKWRCLALAGCVILPSHAENFGMVVAEALAAGTPVAASTATPWQCLEAEDAGWCFAPNASEIAGFLERLATISPQRLDRMGQRGRDLVVRDFSIDTIAGRFAELYKDLAS